MDSYQQNNKWDSQSYPQNQGYQSAEQYQSSNSNNINSNNIMNSNANMAQAAREMQSMSITSGLGEEDDRVNELIIILKKELRDIEDLLLQKESEKDQTVQDINILTQRLKTLNKSIVQQKSIYENYEKTIMDAESAFAQITESTQTLLTVVKKQNNNLGKLMNIKDYKS